MRKTRIVDAAKSFTLSAIPMKDQWVGNNRVLVQKWSNA